MVAAAGNQSGACSCLRCRKCSKCAGIKPAAQVCGRMLLRSGCGGCGGVQETQASQLVRGERRNASGSRGQRSSSSSSSSSRRTTTNHHAAHANVLRIGGGMQHLLLPIATYRTHTGVTTAVAAMHKAHASQLLRCQLQKALHAALQ